MMDFNNKAVSLTIRKLRQTRKQSQEVLSSFAGIARSHLSMIENESKQPNLETIWKIAIAFDMKPHELIQMIEEETERLNK